MSFPLELIEEAEIVFAKVKDRSGPAFARLCDAIIDVMRIAHEDLKDANETIQRQQERIAQLEAELDNL